MGAYCVSRIVLDSGSISRNKRDGIPTVLMSGRKISLQQTHIIFNTITSCALEEKTCTVYYEYLKMGETWPIPGISEGFLEKDS